MKGWDRREGQEWSGGTLTRARCGWESLPESWEASEGPSEEPGRVRRPFWRAGMVERVRMGLEALLEGREGSGSPPKRLGGIRRPSQRIVRDQVSLLGGPGGVWRPFLWDGRVGRARRGREALCVSPFGRSGGTPGKPGGVARSFWRAGRV